jgi:hypothetical protein
MNWDGCGRKLLWPNLRSIAEYARKGLRKTTETLSHFSLYPEQDLNHMPPEYKVRVPIIRAGPSADNRMQQCHLLKHIRI